MQFANDITPLTLASTALLRSCLADKHLTETEKQATQREIYYRWSDESPIFKDTKISLLEVEVEELEEDLEDEEKEHDQTKKELCDAITKLIENGIAFEP